MLKQILSKLHWRTHQQRNFALVWTIGERVTSWPVRRIIGFGGKRFVAGIILVDQPAPKETDRHG